MTTAIAPQSPARPTGSTRRQWLRFVLPLLAISLVIGALGAVGYRYLSEEIRRETHRTLAVITEQKRQQVEAWLGEARIDADLAFFGHSQLEVLFDQWSKGGRRDDGSLARMKSLMEAMAKARGWAGLAVVDAGAKPAFVVGDADVREHAALIRDILQRPRVELVDLHRDASARSSW